jgi:cytochrome P450
VAGDDELKPGGDMTDRRASGEREFPLGAAVTLEELTGDPHATLARLRRHEPVSWVPGLDGWLVTRHDLATAVMSDADTFTVDDPRFSTAQVIGPSMLSLDGHAHVRHRAPFVGPFRAGAVRAGFAEEVARQVTRLIDAVESQGQMELRRQFAGPLSAAVIAHALGLGDDEVDDLLRQYDGIVGSVTSITAGQGPTRQGTEAFTALRGRLESAIVAPDRSSLLARAAATAVGEGALDHDQIASNGAVMLFGGIETTEGMICNAALELLRRPEHLKRIRDQPGLLDPLIDESLRLEPAAAVIDRYATTSCRLDRAEIEVGELVRLSITAANRDPAVFSDPDAFDPSRPNLRRHLAFAQGPHVCVGVHLARLEARTALGDLLQRLPGLRLEPGRTPEIQGLVFRKPARLDVCWG